jgi:hypothetical protein
MSSQHAVLKGVLQRLHTALQREDTCKDEFTTERLLQAVEMQLQHREFSSNKPADLAAAVVCDCATELLAEETRLAIEHLNSMWDTLADLRYQRDTMVAGIADSTSLQYLRNTLLSAVKDVPNTRHKLPLQRQLFASEPCSERSAPRGSALSLQAWQQQKQQQLQQQTKEQQQQHRDSPVSDVSSLTQLADAADQWSNAAAAAAAAAATATAATAAVTAGNKYAVDGVSSAVWLSSDRRATLQEHWQAEAAQQQQAVTVSNTAAAAAAKNSGAGKTSIGKSVNTNSSQVRSSSFVTISYYSRLFILIITIKVCF